MSVILRFAPSPTGYMHIGNARTALVNWLFSRQHQGKFYLRFDDTDLQRSETKYAHAIEKDLAWLGWNFDEKFCQSDRLARYQEVVQHLIASGRLYPCFETPEELALKRKRQLAAGRPPVYDRAALKLDAADHKKLESEGRKPHWRFLLNDEKVTWNDMAHGNITMESGHLSDPVLIREDGSPIYTLSSVVDDMDYGITHIIRGNDHVTNTAVQHQLWQAIGKNPAEICFAHLPLITGEQGEGLSKRLGSLGIAQLNTQGIEPLAISSYLAKLGTRDEIAPAASIEELIKSFAIEKFAQGSPKFMMAELDRLNTKIIHHMSFAEAQEKLKARGLSSVTQDLWDIVHGNLTKLDDLKVMQEICQGEIDPVIEDSDYLQLALQNVPPLPWNEETWGVWTANLKTLSGRKGKDLFMPLRKALTGLDHGPEMQKFLLLIGYEKVVKRLQGLRA